MEISKLKKLKEIKEKPKNKASIDLARKISDRLKMHTEPSVGEGDISFAYKSFISWAKTLFVSETIKNRVEDYLNRGPYPTVNLMERAWKKIERIWYTNDGSKSISASSPEIEKEAKEYLKEKNVDGFVRVDVFNMYKVDPNAFVVVDLPNEVSKAKPEPYTYIVSSFHLLDFDIDAFGNLEYIFFKDGSGKAIFFDKESIVVIPYEGEEIIWNKAREVKNEIGYVPAKKVSHFKLNTSNDMVMTNLAVSSLGEIDWYLLMAASRKYQESYSFMVIEKLEERCGLDECNDGFISVDGNKEPCPQCQSINSDTGPGHIAVKPVPSEGQPDVGDAIKFKNPSVDFLEFSSQSRDNMERNLINNIVGVVEDISNGQAKNEKQLDYGFENRKDILIEQSKNFERIEQWIKETKLKIRYPNDINEVTIKYGQDYYLHNESDVIQKFKTAKESSMPESDLLSIHEEILETRHQNNSIQKDRAMLLLNAEPYPTMSLKELKDLGIDAVDKEGFLMKARFSEFIKWFDREIKSINLMVKSEDPLFFKVEEIKKEFSNFLTQYVEKYGKSESKEEQYPEGAKDDAGGVGAVAHQADRPRSGDDTSK